MLKWILSTSLTLTAGLAVGYYSGASTQPAPMAPIAPAVAKDVKPTGAAGTTTAARAKTPAKSKSSSKGKLSEKPDTKDVADAGTRPATRGPSKSIGADAGKPAPESDRAAVGSSTEDVLERCERSVTLVIGSSASGSGFVVAPGLLATNAHVIRQEDPADIRVLFPSAPIRQRGPLPVRLVYEDPKRDLALLAIESDLPPLGLAQEDEIRKGQEVTVIGNPGMTSGGVLMNALTRGIMSTSVVLGGQSFYQVGLAINPGNSGGPALDARGRVVGVAKSLDPKKQSLSFFIPAVDVKAAVDRVRSAATDHETAAAIHKAKSIYRRVIGSSVFYAAELEKRLGEKGQSTSALRQLGIDEEEQRQGVGLGEIEANLRGDLYDEVVRIRNDERIPKGLRADLVHSWIHCLKLRELGRTPAVAEADDQKVRLRKILGQLKEYATRGRGHIDEVVGPRIATVAAK